MDTIKILSFAGSLRKNSYNKALLHAASELLPADTELEIYDLAGIPLFNQDLDPLANAMIVDFKSKIRTSDALLIATPEYNYSMPGVLKNAIDWASRPYNDNSFEDKPIAIMGASIGAIATARAQYHLRQCCVFLNMHPLNRPEVMVSYANDKFDATGKLTDEATKEFIGIMLENLVSWTKRLQRK